MGSRREDDPRNQLEPGGGYTRAGRPPGLTSGLGQVEEGAFVKEHFDELCWTLTAKKNYRAGSNGNSMLSNQDAFRLWCLFNFLSEDKYPLIMVPDEVRVMAAPGTAPAGARPQPRLKEAQGRCTFPRPLSSLCSHADTCSTRYLRAPPTASIRTPVPSPRSSKTTLPQALPASQPENDL